MFSALTRAAAAAGRFGVGEGVQVGSTFSRVVGAALHSSVPAFKGAKQGGDHIPEPYPVSKTEATRQQNQVRVVPIDSLWRNEETFPANVDFLKEKMERAGRFTLPITVTENETGRAVLDGNTRTTAALELGLEYVPVQLVPLEYVGIKSWARTMAYSPDFMDAIIAHPQFTLKDLPQDGIKAVTDSFMVSVQHEGMNRSFEFESTFPSDTPQAFREFWDVLAQLSTDADMQKMRKYQAEAFQAEGSGVVIITPTLTQDSLFTPSPFPPSSIRTVVLDTPKMICDFDLGGLRDVNRLSFSFPEDDTLLRFDGPVTINGRVYPEGFDVSASSSVAARNALALALPACNQISGVKAERVSDGGDGKTPLAQGALVRVFNEVDIPPQFSQANRLDKDAENPEVVLVRSAKLHKEPSVVDNPQLRAVGRAGSGTDNVPVKELLEEGVMVFNAPGANAQSVAELILAQLLNHYRNIPQAMSRLGMIREGYSNAAASDLSIHKPQGILASAEAVKSEYVGQELGGKKITIVGGGAVGTALAKLALAFGMKPTIVDRPTNFDRLRDTFKGQPVQFVDSLVHQLEDSDVIALTLPKQREPVLQGLARIPKGAVVMNFSRAGMIPSKDSKILRDRGVTVISDFPDEAPGVDTPHLGASTVEAEQRSGQVVTDNIQGFLDTGNLKGAVGFESLVLPVVSPHRIAISGCFERLEGMVKPLLESSGTTVLQSGTAEGPDGHVYCIFDISSPVDSEAIERFLDFVPSLRVSSLDIDLPAALDKEMQSWNAEPTNFVAGPCKLFPEVGAAMAEVVSGPTEAFALPLSESSHRDPAVGAMMEDAKRRLESFFDVPASFKTGFYQGGATEMFNGWCENFVMPGDKVLMVVNGAWSKKASVAASYFVHPNDLTVLNADAKLTKADIAGYNWVYVCTNETIHGVRQVDLPELEGGHYIVDASSDLGCSPSPFEKDGKPRGDIACVFAGAQKCLGIAGVTVGFMDPSLLKSVESMTITPANRHLVKALSDNPLNTPPVVPIYSVHETAGALQRRFESKEDLAAYSEKRAQIVYDVLDRFPGFYKSAVKEGQDCSVTNIVFNLPTPELEEEFIAYCKSFGLIGLKGHKSIGGCRASLYPASTVEEARKLRTAMLSFLFSSGRLG